MDLSPQQVQEIQEIEKQVNQGVPTGPRIVSQKEEKGKSLLKNILAALGITAVGTGAILLLIALPFAKKKVSSPVITTTTSTVQLAKSPAITVTTQYVNPFSQTAQYSNPFTETQNPFSQFTQ